MTNSKQLRQQRQKPAGRQVQHSGMAISLAGLLLYAGSLLPATTIERLSTELVLCGGLLSGIGLRAYHRSKQGAQKQRNGATVS